MSKTPSKIADTARMDVIAECDAFITALESGTWKGEAMKAIRDRIAALLKSYGTAWDESANLIRSQSKEIADLRAHSGRKPAPTTGGATTFSGLSFVKRSRKPGQSSNWHLPMPTESIVEESRKCPDGGTLDRDTALYGIGCRQGQRAADEWLDYVALRGDDYIGGGTLQHIALAMLDADRRSTDGNVRGQIVGFMTAVEAALEVSQ